MRGELARHGHLCQLCRARTGKEEREGENASFFSLTKTMTLSGVASRARGLGLGLSVFAAGARHADNVDEADDCTSACHLLKSCVR